jgi:hypothetical protein
VPCDPSPCAGDAVPSSSSDCTISTLNILYIAWRDPFHSLTFQARPQVFPLHPLERSRCGCQQIP